MAVAECHKQERTLHFQGTFVQQQEEQPTYTSSSCLPPGVSSPGYWYPLGSIGASRAVAEEHLGASTSVQQHRTLSLAGLHGDDFVHSNHSYPILCFFAAICLPPD